MIEYGDSVYIPVQAIADNSTNGATHTGPLGRWIKRSDPDYDQAFAEQSKLESSWIEARENAGDG